MRVGFIGTGNMGGAILKGYAASKASAGKELLVCNRTDERNKAIEEAVANAGGKVLICGSPGEIADKSDIIIIGVKPAGVTDILKEISPTGNKLIVSMAAGVSIETMEKAVEGCESAKIMRIMPNTPAQVGEAMTSISRNSAVTDEDLETTMEIFNSVGLCEEVPEDMIDCVIGVSGSSPAYTYMYIDALVRAAVDNGMEPAKARAFASQAVIGAAKMVQESDESLEQLRINVCSPGGTTIEAVNKLIENGFEEKVKEGFQAAVDRSIEMTGKKRKA